jgi:hypothetical protein
MGVALYGHVQTRLAFISVKLVSHIDSLAVTGLC